MEIWLHLKDHCGHCTYINSFKHHNDLWHQYHFSLILQMRKRRFRELSDLPRVTAGMWYCLGFKHRGLVSESASKWVLFTLLKKYGWRNPFGRGEVWDRRVWILGLESCPFCSLEQLIIQPSSNIHLDTHCMSETLCYSSRLLWTPLPWRQERRVWLLWSA